MFSKKPMSKYVASHPLGSVHIPPSPRVRGYHIPSDVRRSDVRRSDVRRSDVRRTDVRRTTRASTASQMDRIHSKFRSGSSSSNMSSTSYDDGTATYRSSQSDRAEYGRERGRSTSTSSDGSSVLQRRAFSPRRPPPLWTNRPSFYEPRARCAGNEQHDITWSNLEGILTGRLVVDLLRGERRAFDGWGD